MNASQLETQDFHVFLQLPDFFQINKHWNCVFNLQFSEFIDFRWVICFIANKRASSEKEEGELGGKDPYWHRESALEKP